MNDQKKEFGIGLDLPPDWETYFENESSENEQTMEGKEEKGKEEKDKKIG